MHLGGVPLAVLLCSGVSTCAQGVFSWLVSVDWNPDKVCTMGSPLLLCLVISAGLTVPLPLLIFKPAISPTAGQTGAFVQPSGREAISLWCPCPALPYLSRKLAAKPVFPRGTFVGGLSLPACCLSGSQSS